MMMSQIKAIVVPYRGMCGTGRCGANRTSACGRDDLSRAFLRGTMGALPGSRIITNNTHRRADTVVQAEPTLVLSKDK